MMTKEELKKISDKYGKGIFTCRGEPSPEFVDAAHTVVKLLDYIKELEEVISSVLDVDILVNRYGICRFCLAFEPSPPWRNGDPHEPDCVGLKLVQLVRYYNEN